VSARPYHKRYHSDALAGFMSLSLEERGAYQTLLDLIYDRGGPIPDHERLLAGYMGCSVRKWRTLRDVLIAKRKITINSNGEISNSRAEKELENDAKTSRKLAENGLKGARALHEIPKKGNENSESDVATPKPGHGLSQKPEARSHSLAKAGHPPEPVRDAVPPGEFEQRCRSLAQIINLTRPIAASDRDQLRAWLKEGFHFDWHIVEGAKLVAAREEGRGGSVRSFKYLDGGIREYRAEWLAERARLKGEAA
jgi:uncharacterized protein YdaU (DUF1376 family)